MKGYNELMAKLEAMGGSHLDEASQKIASSMGRAHQAAAKMMVGGESGELRNSIRMTSKHDNEEPTAYVYTNSDHAAFVEFGTGPIGEASGGNGSSLKMTYAKGPWKHEIKKGPRAGTVYYTNFWIYRTEEGKFFSTRGQPARPYLYPSAMEVQKQAPRITYRVAKNFLKGVV